MGGSTLSLLHDRTFNYTGDSQAQELCLYLTKAASVPYFEMLEKWIYRGIIKDPYGYRNLKTAANMNYFSGFRSSIADLTAQLFQFYLDYFLFPLWEVSNSIGI